MKLSLLPYLRPHFHAFPESVKRRLDPFMRLDARVAHVAKNGIGVEFFNVTAEDQKALKTCFDLFRHTLPKIDG